MRVARLLAGLAILTVLAAPPAVAADSYGYSSPEAAGLRGLYRDAGLAFPRSSYPMSAAELRDLAELLAARALDPSIRDAAVRFLAERLPAAGVSDIGFSASAGIEWSYWGPMSSLGPMVDVVRLYLERQPLAAFTMDSSTDGKFAMGLRMPVDREYFMDRFAPWNLPGSEPGNPVALENHNLREGWLRYDFDPLVVELGRDSAFQGSSAASIMLNPALPFLDELRLKLPMGRLSMDAIYSTLEARAASADVPGLLAGSEVGSKVLLLASHRFEYAFDWARVGVEGLQVLSRAGNAFQLADFFPVFSWHQSDIAPNNLVIVFDGEIVPLPGLSVSFQYGLDDINVSAGGIADSGAPTIDAGILSAEGGFRSGDLAIGLYAEAGFTHYLWGNYASPAGGNEAGRAIYRLLLDRDVALMPLTSPYGPGAYWAELRATLAGIPGLSASLRILYLDRNSLADLVSTPYASSSSVADAPRARTLRIEAKVAASPFDWLAVRLEPSLCFDDGGTWLEFSAALSVRYASSGPQRPW